VQSVPSATPRLLPDDSAVSYPLARLRLGICYVGALVLGAIGLLLLDLRASEVFAEITGRLGVIPSVGLLIGIFTLMTFPLDLMGGFSCHAAPAAGRRRSTTGCVHGSGASSTTAVSFGGPGSASSPSPPSVPAWWCRRLPA